MKKLHPLVFHIIQGFGFFNIILSSVLYLLFPGRPLTVVSSIIPQYLWATIFLVTGLLLLYTLYKCHYKAVRFLMIFGLFIKTMWFIGLLLTAALDAPNTVYAGIFWGFIAYIQFLGVIYFLPPKEEL